MFLYHKVGLLEASLSTELPACPLRSLSPDDMNEILGELGYRYPLVFGSVCIKDSVVAAVSVVDSSQVGAVLQAIAKRVAKDCGD